MDEDAIYNALLKVRNAILPEPDAAVEGDWTPVRLGSEEYRRLAGKAQELVRTLKRLRERDEL